ncbi:MAG: hypothetical protein AAF611_11785 [Bacteroidota bacterium]
MNRFLYIIIFSLFCIQCDKKADTAVPIKNVEGKYVHLEKENIYLFVPEKVKMFTHSEQLKFINSIENPQIQAIERARYLNLKYGVESSYMLRSEDLEIDITYVKLPYMPIDQSVSQELLKFLNREHKATGKVLGLESSFSRAGIIKLGSDRIFRAIFLYKGIDLLTGKDAQIYTYFYLLNRKGKTFMLSFNSRAAYDFDSYVQKIRL